MGERTSLGQALEGVERVMVGKLAPVQVIITHHHGMTGIGYIRLPDDTPVTIDGDKIMDLAGNLICEVRR